MDATGFPDFLFLKYKICVAFFDKNIYNTAMPNMEKFFIFGFIFFTTARGNKHEKS